MTFNRITNWALDRILNLTILFAIGWWLTHDGWRK